MERTKVYHTLQPVFDANSRVLILGSMPSPKSREVGFYYGHPQNRFWRVLAAVLGEPFPVGTDERRAMVLSHGIALWDVLASCEINGASDASIRDAQPNDYARILDVCDIRAVFTVGRTAHDYYAKFGGDSIYLPSPSAANAAMSLEALTRRYAVIRQFLD